MLILVAHLAAAVRVQAAGQLVELVGVHVDLVPAAGVRICAWVRVCTWVGQGISRGGMCRAVCDMWDEAV